MRHPSARLAMAASAGLALILTACGSPSTASTSGGQTTDSKINVVASTSVYADIVSSIGGDKVSVTPIINKTSQDPHSYEATAQDKLAVSKARLVVENGGGYDGFLHTLADESKVEHDNIVTAVEVSGLVPADEHSTHTESSASAPAADGHGHSHEGFNEHVWYNFDAMAKLADVIAEKLGALDPGSASTFTANAGTFKSSLAGLSAKLKDIKGANDGAPVAITEPVPLYLLEAAGLSDKTPEGYSEAIEEGSDVPPAVLKETVDLVSAKGVRLLAYNSQTAGPQTETVRSAAEQAGVPVVEFTETLPEGRNYIQWMTSNVDAVAAALSGTAAKQ